MASYPDWVHQFCLTCDKQTDGATYCSESCRLADFEEATPYLPLASAHHHHHHHHHGGMPAGVSPYHPSWAPTTRSRQLFNLTPAYDFRNAQPYGSTPAAARPPPPPPTMKMVTATTAAPPALLPTVATTSAATTTTSVTYRHALSPSSSHSSLSSMRSSGSSASAGSSALSALSAFANGSTSGSQTTYGSAASSGGAAGSTDLSAKIRSELRKYASSLEQGKLQRDLQRRRSC